MANYLVTGIAHVPFEFEIEADSVEEAEMDAETKARERIEDTFKVTNLHAELDE